MDTREAGRLGGLKGGRSRSASKLAACRKNGKLGGRPKKSVVAGPVKIVRQSDQAPA